MPSGVQVRRLRPLVRYGNAPLLPALFAEASNFDLAHLHLPFYGGAEPLALLRQLKRIPLVITHHQDVKLAGPLRAISALHDRFIGGPLMCAADRVCFTSLDYAASSKFAPLIEQGKLHAVALPNGVDIHRFTPGPRPAHLVERYCLAGRNVVLFVGVLDRAHYFKGVDVLLRACAALDRASTALIVVGKGEMLPEYQRAAHELGIANNVHFAGFVPDAELADYYRLADVTVLPSTTAGEAFGLVLIEALACGTPVIASALPGVRTVVADGQDGYLVPPNSAYLLARSLADMLALPTERREIMGRAGRRNVEAHYSWERIGDTLEALYEDIFNEYRQRTDGTIALNTGRLEMRDER